MSKFIFATLFSFAMMMASIAQGRSNPLVTSGKSIAEKNYEKLAADCKIFGVPPGKSWDPGLTKSCQAETYIDVDGLPGNRSDNQVALDNPLDESTLFQQTNPGEKKAGSGSSGTSPTTE